MMNLFPFRERVELEATRTRSPCPLRPRIFLGTASKVRPSFPRQTLVFHVWPSTVGELVCGPTRGHRRCILLRTGANTQPPLPGYCHNVAINSGR